MKKYGKPSVVSQRTFETSALGCAKTSDPPPGSFHTTSAYDTFTGHFGRYAGASESLSGSVGIGFGPGGTSGSGMYEIACGWVVFSS
jgi:hypothetical protein